jgi:hypothetical protein
MASVYLRRGLFLAPCVGTPLAPFAVGSRHSALAGSRMLSMLTAPALTLLFLGVVVSLGVAFVWVLWEIEQFSKSHRNSGRFG